MRATWLGPLVALCLASASAAGPDFPTLDRAWICPIESGVEWAQLTGRGRDATVLVATRDARLMLLGGATGVPQLAETIGVGRGVRFAGTDDQMAYAFDRHAAYALRLSRAPGLAWQYGRCPPDGEEFEGDPESLVGWCDAHPTRWGLLLANRDGRVVHLRRDTGQAVWEIQLSHLAVARMHVRADTAVILWKTRAQVRAAFLDLNGEDPRVTERKLGEDWPVWSTLVPEGLLTLTPGRGALWPSAGPAREWSIDVPDPRVAAIDASVPPHRDASERGRGSTQLILADGASLVAYDVLTGAARRWGRFPRWPEDIESLMTQDGLCRLQYPGFVAIRDVSRGAFVGGAGGRAPGERVLAADLSGHELRVLFAARRGAEESLTLCCSAVRAPGEWSLRAAPRTFGGARLVAPGDVRQVLWSDRHVVLVTPNALLGYRLPRVDSSARIRE